MEQVTDNKKARVQALYWLKIGAVETTEHIAVLLNCHRTTTSRWLTLYREGGIPRLLEYRKSPDRPPLITSDALESLKKELTEPDGFKSQVEIKFWLKLFWELDICYWTVYRCVRQGFKAKLKVPRPQHIKQTHGIIEEFKNQLGELLKYSVERIRAWYNCEKTVRFWCQDETRAGLMTSPSRRITLKGVKPRQSEKWEFKSFWLYGLIEPISGQHFFYEFSNLDTGCFERYLELFSQKYSNKLHVIQLDNSPAHQSLTLSMPEGIILLFQPSYSPEINPIERLWLEFKRQLKKRDWFNDLYELRQAVSKILEELSSQVVTSLSKWGFIVDALCIAGI